MQSIVERQTSAIASLYERYGKTLKKVIYQVLQDEAEADDVLQESILQVWREAASYSSALGKPLGWLVTIARRRASVTVSTSWTAREAVEGHSVAGCGA